MMTSTDNYMKKKNDDGLPEAEIVLVQSGWEKLKIPTTNINYAVTGHESQVLTMKLTTGETLQGEPGSMMYLTGGVKQHVSYEGCCERLCSGEDCFVVNFTNTGASSDTAYAALCPNFPTAKIVPVDMSSPHVNGKLIAQQGSFMASYGDVSIGISLDCNFVRCCCSGLGLVRQKLEGTGTVFLASTGTMVQKVLQPDETILVDTNCIMAFADSCKLDLKRAGGVLGIVGGGEGFFNTTLTGPGLVIVQSMNETVFREALVANKLYRR
jgi:uncharacterized protein (AIM24 family)